MYRDPITKRHRYQALMSALLTDRSAFDAYWRDLADYIVPTRTRFTTTDRNRHQKRNQNIIDSTGTFAASTLESGMHAGLTSPARPWMLLTTPDPDLATFGPVKEWLHIVTQRMMAVFSQSNLYNALPIVYGDMGVFGTAAIAVLDDTDDLVRCYAYPLGSYALGLDRRGRVTTFAREVQMTVRQVVEEYGVIPGRVGQGSIDWSRISTRVKEQWDRHHYETPVDVEWMVLPNEEADPRRLGSQYLPWASCHFEKGSDERTFLRESGFRNFPILTPRWKVTSHEDSYGTDCPGMRALGDIKQLQFMEKKKGQAISKMIDPPLVAPNALRHQATSLLPGGITYTDERDGQKGLRPIHETRPQLSEFAADQDRVRWRIQRAFHEDLFLMLATRDQRADSAQPVTAREIVERHEEKLLALGPVLERANDELLEPLVDRVYGMMEAAGLIPEPPEELQGVDLKVEFISILAQAQKSVGVAAQDRFLQSVGALAQVFPEVRHKVNPFRAVDNYGEMLGVDPRLVRSDDDAQERAGADAKAQQAGADAQQAKDLASAAHSASQTPMGGDTALTRVIQGAA